MRLPLHVRDVPGRLVTGAFIFHAGLEKWPADQAHATAVHGMAAGAFPVLGRIPAVSFCKMLAATEIAVWVSLLAPVVPTAVAGAALTGFSGALVAMYARTPALRQPGSIWPTPAGIAVSKDVWMLGMGAGFLVGGGRRRGRGGR